MKWETHRKIADRIAEDLGLREELKKELRNASILPDKWRNYPHHEGKSGEIRYRVRRARHQWLRGNTVTAIAELGVAFHYITDQQGLPHSHPMHEEYEEEMMKYSPIPLQVEVPKGKKATLGLASYSLRKVDGPLMILSAAYSICLAVAKSVLSNPNPPAESGKLMEQSWKNYQNAYRKLKLFGLGLIGLPLVFLAYPAGAILGIPGAICHFWLGKLLIRAKSGRVAQILELSKLYERIPKLIGFWIFIGILGLIWSWPAVISGIIVLLGYFVKRTIAKSIHPEIRDNWDWYRWKVLDLKTSCISRNL